MSGENISKHLILGGSLWDFVGWSDDDTKNLSDVTRWINRWVDIVLSNAWIPKRKPLVLSWKPKIKRINIDLAFEYVIDKNQSHDNILVFINCWTWNNSFVTWWIYRHPPERFLIENIR